MERGERVEGEKTDYDLEDSNKTELNSSLLRCILITANV